MAGVKGERELAVRFETFPQDARQRIEQRINAFVDRLQGRIQGAAPYRTGRLRSEIKGRVYSTQTRVAGYVSVYAPGAPNEYPKAATLEYGSNKPRRAFERGGGLVARLTGSRRRIVSRISKPVHIDALRYLRGPFDDLAPEFRAEIDAALNEVTTQ